MKIPFMFLQQPPLPVVYPQPPAVMADPNWYPYHQMMLYQLSPQGYVPTPTHYLGGGIPGAVYHPYPGKLGRLYRHPATLDSAKTGTKNEKSGFATN